MKSHFLGQESYPRIPEYFENKTVFLTGGSGFIGTVLIEKLLRSCPGIRRIYLLLRPKKGLCVDERRNKIFNPDLFSKLDKETCGSWKDKIEFIDGDVTKLNLGISAKDEAVLTSEVNIFFHNAASVRFDDSLKSAIIMNARGTREACNLALKMKNIEMFCHVSTTYCNIHRGIVHEVILPPEANWQEMIYLAEHMDEQELQQISTKLMDHFPNTYTFSKNLAEHVVNDLCNDKIPSIVIRPSIVISTESDPIAGWSNNFNGPAGFFAASAKGIMRVNLVDQTIKVDCMPVDYLVKFMICVVHYRRTRENEKSLRNLQVYNASADLQYAVDMKRMVEIAKDTIDEVPVENPLWYPFTILTTSKLCFFVLTIVLQVLPALLVDAVLKLTGNKPMLFKIQKKIYTAVLVLHCFMSTQWQFVNQKIQSIMAEVQAEDEDGFSCNFEVDQNTFFKNSAIGGKIYLLKDDLKDLDKHKKRLFQMKILHYVTITVFWMLVLYGAYTQAHRIKNYLHRTSKFI